MSMNTCAHCDKTFEAQRFRATGFCSSNCRVAHHREKLEHSKRLSAIQALGYATGLKHIFDADGLEASQRLKHFSSQSLFMALADMGYVYANGSWVKGSHWLDALEEAN